MALCITFISMKVHLRGVCLGVWGCWCALVSVGVLRCGGVSGCIYWFKLTNIYIQETGFYGGNPDEIQRRATLMFCFEDTSF